MFSDYYIWKGLKMNEKGILKDILNGVESSFEEAFRSLYAPLCGYSQKYLKDQESAEEIVQDVFCNLWEKRGSIKITTSLSSYLYTSVRNRCLNEIRRLKNVDTEGVDDGKIGGWDDNSIEALELDQKIEDAIAQLPEMSRRVFELSRFEGKKYKEISEELSIGVKAVEANMSRALKKLREDLKEFLISIILIFLN